MRPYSKSQKRLPRSSKDFLGFKREVLRSHGTPKPHVYLTEDILLVGAERPGDSVGPQSKTPLQKRRYVKTRFWR